MANKLATAFKYAAGLLNQFGSYDSNPDYTAQSAAIAVKGIASRIVNGNLTTKPQPKA